MVGLTIRPAVYEDIPRMAELYDLAREAMREMGTDQWQDGYPNAATAREDIDRGISAVVTENGLILATAAVYVGHEPTYDAIWGGEWLTSNAAYGIIHRIAVDPSAKRRGIATFIMDRCTSLARAAGATSQRCDTHHGNVPMRRTLERNGYRYCGTIRLTTGALRAAYEKII